SVYILRQVLVHICDTPPQVSPLSILCHLNPYRNSKPINLPTCIQAEVLIRDGIPLADIMEIVIRSPRHEQNVRQAGWRGNIRVSSRDFDWHSEWIVRGS
ncbi:hypothetical protein, partial [Nostoc sp.]|uniref:hypothetical protein n=1 Tax=Nostoc sp. TaxID=1180 RepID=UPI002FFAC20E